jgi:uncharacterized DUF497 family protein
VYFQWYAAKAKANLRKHGVSFDEAASVFFDPHAVSGDDPDHSADESRFITFGVSSRGRLLTIIPHRAWGVDPHNQRTPWDKN